jgi:hypothetical protein
VLSKSIFGIFVAAAIKILLLDFFDSSCYENSKYGILIAAAMGHIVLLQSKVQSALRSAIPDFKGL